MWGGSNANIRPTNLWELSTGANELATGGGSPGGMPDTYQAASQSLLRGVARPPSCGAIRLPKDTCVIGRKCCTYCAIAGG